MKPTNKPFGDLAPRVGSKESMLTLNNLILGTVLGMMIGACWVIYLGMMIVTA